MYASVDLFFYEEAIYLNKEEKLQSKGGQEIIQERELKNRKKEKKNKNNPCQ